MNRNEARKLAETVTMEQLRQMLVNAQKGIKDWKEVSNVNRGMTKGTAFNFLSPCVVEDNIHVLAKTNLIWEFGEFLAGYKKPDKPKRQEIKAVHQEPKFIVRQG